MNKYDHSKVSVIEGQLSSAEALQVQLNRKDYEVSGIAGSEDEALHFVETDGPDLILSGLHPQQNPDNLDIAKTTSEDIQVFSERDKSTGDAKALKERQKFFWLASALNSAADGIIIVNPDGRVEFINHSAEHLTGYRAEQAFGRHFREVLVLEHHGARVVDDLIRLAMFNDAPLNLGNDLVLVSGDGHRCEIEGEVAAASDSVGTPGSVVFTFRDVTQRKWEEHQHKQEHAIRAVERLAETTAHTLNNLLTTILGNADFLLCAADLPKEDRDHVTQVHTAALGVAAVVNRLSTISRTRFATHQKLDVNSLIETFLPTLSDTMLSGITLRTELDPEISQVVANRAQLEQVLFNLIANARDAIADTGQIVISTQQMVHDIADRSGSRRTFVTVKVRDDGEGMSKETCEQMFEPFFTLRSDRGRAGIGLSTTQGIIRDYKGFIDVRSEPGAGTEITFGIPCPEEDPFAFLDKDGADAEPSAKTILLVEDDYAVRLLIRNILQRHGYQVIEARDGDDALMLSELHDGRVDLLITDVSMPGLSGPDLIRQFAPIHSETSFLLISGFSAAKVGLDSSLPAHTEFLQKPFRQKDLLARIEQILAGGRDQA